LIADVARGVPVEIACTAVGIDRKTFYNWLDQRPEFAQALAAEKQRFILEALSGIRTGSKNDEWRGHAWFLERVYRDHFAPPDQAALAFTQNNFTISFEKARQIEETRAKLLPEVHAMLGLTNGETNGSEPRA
jgi:CRP-like cAMP-binding protein